MKVLLAACNAKYIHSNLAVYSLQAFAGKYRENVVLREYTINQLQEDIRKDIYLQQPDVVCVSCYIWNISFVRELIRDLAKVLPDTVFWAGGPEVSYDAEAFLQRNPAFTGVMVGEGEETFLELMAYYVDGKGSLADIRGIAYRCSKKSSDAGWEMENQSDICCAVHRMKEGQPDVCANARQRKNTVTFFWGKNENAGYEAGTLSAEETVCVANTFNAENSICHNGWRETLDLSRIPFVYKNLQDFEHRIIYYESSRGCPFSCSYCLSSVDKRLRFRSLDLVLPELQFFLDHQVPQVKFVDRTFNCKHNHAMTIWKYIAEHDNGVTNFHFEISADLLREEELALMQTMRPGLIQLEIGVQSTNPKTIQAIRRTMDFPRLAAIVNRIHSFGNIHQHLDLIAGLPYEDYDSFRKSFNDVYALRPEQLQLGFLKVLKGSYMMEKVSDYGIVYTEKEPYEVLSTKWLSYYDVLRLKKVEKMVEVYYNSGQFPNTLRQLEKCFPDAFSLYQELGDYYEEKGYEEISHSRLRRYEILLEFVKERTQGNLWQAADAMILDLYLRENLKSRPAFAYDQKPFEKAVWEYRRREKVPKTAHVEVFRDGRTLLFNYDKRDPLTGNALVREVSLEGFI